MERPVVPKTARRPRLGRGSGRWAAFDGTPVNLTLSGRTAILGGLRELGIPQGAVVLMPAWHCGSEVDAVMAAGGVPVLYRLMADMTPDFDDLERKAREKVPWGIYVIHYFGYAQPVARVRAIAERHRARLIEDMALGLLSRDATGRPLGRAGQMTIFSLVKTLVVPDGGALWLKDRILGPRFSWPGPRQELRGLAMLAKSRRRRVGSLKDRFEGASESDLDRWSANAGIDASRSLNAASLMTNVLLALMNYGAIRDAHRHNYQALWEGFSDHPAARPVLGHLPEGACPAYFPLRVEDPDAASAAFAASGVESVRFWRRFHHRVDLTAYPEIVDLKRRTIRLPVHPDIGEGAIERMIDALA
jgi:dTDP-4-amino-4,6-dideoxygalactose transaminase